jgi:putative tricarboxylic transport membrane protein
MKEGSSNARAFLFSFPSAFSRGVPVTNPQQRPRVALADLLLALGVIGLGVFFLIGAFQIDVSAGYARVGPRFFPLIVAVGLIVMGAWLVLEAAQGKRAEPASEEDADPNVPTNWGAFAWLTLGLVLEIVLMNPLGFVVASSVVFWCAAKAFQSNRPWRDLAAALIVSVVSYIAFTRGLGLTLPAGILNGIL